MLRSVRTFLSLSVVLVVASGCATGPAASPSGGRFDHKLEAWDAEGAPGLAMAVMMEGEVVYAGAVGLADVAHGVPNSPATVFHGASLTKQFTGFAISNLAAEGKVALDEDIKTYLPELSYGGPTITVQHLLDHMSGLREANSLAPMAGWGDADVFSDEQRLRILEGQTALNFLPGERVEYSNSGYGLLAEIVARAAGVPFRAYLAETYFEPLGMSQTQMRTDITEVIPHRATSYQPVSEGFVIAPLNYELVGSTGLQTTVLDLLAWGKALNERALGSAEAWAVFEERTAAHSGEPASLGRGQELRPYRGHETWSHGGTDAGYRSFLIRIPSENFAIAIMSNRFDVDTAKLAYGIIDDVFHGGPAAPEPFEPATPAQLEAYAGAYELFPGVIFSVSTDGEELFFAPYGAGQGHAIPQIGEGWFLVGGATDLSIRFLEPEAGRSAGFRWTLGLHGSIPARRIETVAFDPDTQDLESFSGRYFSEELGVAYEVRSEGGVLMMHHHKKGSGALSPFQPDVFFGGLVQEVRFVRGSRGEVTGALLSNSLADDVLFERVE